MSRARVAVPAAVAEPGVIAILRAGDGALLEAVAQRLASAGVRCLELTMTTPGALDALRRLRPSLDSSVALGMGTVITGADAEAAIDAGAEFLVSPGVCSDVARTAGAAGVDCYPGAFTATEILAAWEAGATAVKLFPASAGGPAMMRNLRGPLPAIPLIPTGGVEIAQIADYIAAGAVAVGLGGPLIGDALDGGSLDALAQRAASALEAVARGRLAG